MAISVGFVPFRGARRRPSRGNTNCCGVKRDVRFVSSLTHEQENVFARAILKAMAGLLDLLSIRYSIRIETSTDQVYKHSRAAENGLLRPSGTDLELPA